MGFSEFTPEIHHTQWTVRFAGHPSGPDWYVNLDDNSLSHGPGMQEHHALTEDADLCFGKVIKVMASTLTLLFLLPLALEGH